MTPNDLRAALAERAAELGFVAFGVAEAAALERDQDALRRWLAAGHHASMTWMAETAAVRADPRHPGMLPSARRVIALATPYDHGPAAASPLGSVARYARGRDYHNVLTKRLRKLTRLLRDAGHEARAGSDSLPILERAWAERAGIGFIGKNCCLIVPGVGSHVFLSVIVTSAELPVDRPMAPRCGECRACLDVCPTDAFVAPRELDARRCISYLTIEHDGPIDPGLREGVGDWVFGCDVCQDVCPFNRGRGAPPDAAFAEHPRSRDDVGALLTMTPDEHREWAEGSPLRRAGASRLARNAALVIGNRAARRHLPVLRELRDTSPDDAVRDAAAWAAEKLE